MTWRDRIIPASWRGVPFLVAGDEAAFGRRTVTHEYPQRDKPYVEDLGRASREIRLEGFLLGDDVLEQRDRMVRALEEPGPGTLEDPWLGRLTATLKEAGKVAHRADAQGRVSLALVFIEAAERVFPSSASDTQGTAAASADDAATALAETFEAEFATSGFSAHVETAATDLVGQLGTAVGALADGLSALDTGYDALRARLAALDPLALVRAPASLAAEALAMAAGLRGAGSDLREGFRALLRLAGWGDSFRPVAAVAPATTPGRARLAANQAALLAVARRAAVIEAARVAATRSYASYDEAAATRTALADALAAEILRAGDAGHDGDWRALRTLRAAAIADLTARGASLARYVTARYPDVLPALVIAYDRYEDALRDGEIVADNEPLAWGGTGGGPITHPGFVPGGVDLRFLSA